MRGAGSLAPRLRRWAPLLPPLAIVLAGAAAYYNSFHAPFVFDARGHVMDNPAIRHLWPPDILRHSTRPLTNLSLALNYAVGGFDVFGYHLANLVIHLCAGLVLYGLLRRTLLTERLRPRYGERSTLLAAVITLLWTLHPLQTQAVTYVIQRAESLMGLFFLLTLYSLHRSALDPSARRWRWTAVGACALGMASKPFMVTCPLAALLYDRVFLAGSWQAAWRARRRLHQGLMATWGILIWILLQPHESRATSGFAATGCVDPLGYLATQPQVVLHYLRLAVWPSPLMIDYGWPIERNVFVIVVTGAVLLGLFALTIRLLRHRPAAGFLGAWVFLTLAPSSLVPLADVAVEHRMYLALAAVMAAAVLAAEALLRRARLAPAFRSACLGIAGVSLAGLLGLLTVQRNAVYRSEISLWEDVVRKRPGNVRGYNNLGMALHENGRFLEALETWQRAVEVDPAGASRSNLGAALMERGEHARAIAELTEALRLAPNDADAHNYLGEALLLTGVSEEAIEHLRQAVALNPDLAEARNNLAVALMRTGRLEEARAEVGEALRLDPANPYFLNNLGQIHQKGGRWEDAVAAYRDALALNRDLGNVWANLGLALVRLERTPEAVEALTRARELSPHDTEVEETLRRITVGEAAVPRPSP